ncbi:hypothetical protein, partial [Klebsiella pneumoniae]|uniref:hypothetical protein n=1 Tax=Klebsiella pneumoniae TaxID=573 RepID=UPI001D0E3E0C
GFALYRVQKSIDHDGHYRFSFSVQILISRSLQWQRNSLTIFTHLIAQTYALSRSIIQALLPSTRLFAERSRFPAKKVCTFSGYCQHSFSLSLAT